MKTVEYCKTNNDRTWRPEWMLAMLGIGLIIFALPGLSIAQEAQVRVVVTRADQPLRADAEKMVSVQLNRLVKVRVDPATAAEMLVTRSLVRNSKGIAAGNAEAADELARSAVNLSGVSEAGMLLVEGGVVRLAFSGEENRHAKAAPRRNTETNIAWIK